MTSSSSITRPSMIGALVIMAAMIGWSVARASGVSGPSLSPSAYVPLDPVQVFDARVDGPMGRWSRPVDPSIWWW